VRVLGVDYGARRIGLAVSDDTATLARPWMSLEAAGKPAEAARAVHEFLTRMRETDPDTANVGSIVVGLPSRLSGGDTDQSEAVREFAAALMALTRLTVHFQDERLSSREAESRLALREKDWRKRKARLDAASAAVILQDYLDRG
jgi:putative Holliday junction resolvase